MRLGADRAGHGPTLVLLHPLGADRRVWDGVIERVGAQRECIAVDLPGFGSSEPLAEDCSPRALATAVADWLVAEGIERPHVVGNSLGGWVALELGLAGVARAVTAIAPAGLWSRPLPPKPNVARRLSRGALPLLRPMTLGPHARRLLLAAAVAHPDRVSARDAAALIRSYATAPGFEAVNAAMRAGTFTELWRIPVPVTLVWPERDRLIVPPRELPSSVESVTLPDAGHIPMLEDPAGVAEVLLAARDPAVDGAWPATADDARQDDAV